jgi:hypothetical protein
MTATTEILDLVRRWAAAEQQNDPGLLDGVLADDFQGGAWRQLRPVPAHAGRGASR